MSQINMTEIMCSKLNIHYREECPPLKAFANDNFTMTKIVSVLREAIKFKNDQKEFIGALANILEKHVVSAEGAQIIKDLAAILRRYESDLKDNKI